MAKKKAEQRTQLVSWVLAGGVGCALIVGVGKVVKDLVSCAKNLDRPKARWEDEPRL